MNAAQLEATFSANRVPILAAAGAGVVGLAMLHRKKAAATPSPAATVTTAPAAATAGTVPLFSAGGQTAAMTGGAYDSTSSDLYGALSPQLSAIGQQLSQLNNPPSPLPVPAPAAPIASTLSAPTGKGTSYVRYPNGTISEVESDGSLFAIPSWNQWLPIAATGASWQQLPATPTKTTYTAQGNLMSKING